MPSYNVCCVPSCKTRTDSNIPLHIFPNPKKYPKLFNEWVDKIIGENFVGLNDTKIFKTRRVCHLHFEEKYWCRYNRICKGAIPTLYMIDVVMHVFPNPKKYPERFKTWVDLVGGDFQTLSDDEIYKRKRICEIHFCDNDRNRFKRLNAMAVPSLHLPSASRHELPHTAVHTQTVAFLPDNADLGIVHRFPSLKKYPERFKEWVAICGGKLETEADYNSYRKKIVCDAHFANKDRTHNCRLISTAVPTLRLYAIGRTVEKDAPNNGKHEDHTYAKTDQTEENEPPRGQIINIPPESKYTDDPESNYKTGLADILSDDDEKYNSDDEIKTLHTLDNNVPGTHNDEEVKENIPLLDEKDSKKTVPKYYISEQFNLIKKKSNDVHKTKSEKVPKPVLLNIGFFKHKLKSVLHSKSFCALCYDSDKNLKSLYDRVSIGNDNWTQTLRLRHIYEYVFHQKAEQAASQSICTDCSEQLKQSYSFIKYSKLTTKLLETYINDLKLKSFDEVDTETGPFKERMGIVLENNLLYKYHNTQQQTKECESIDQEITQEYEGTEEIVDTAKIITKKTRFMSKRSTPKIDLATKPTCEICSKKFVKPSALVQHYAVAHVKVPCEICLQLVDEAGLNEHLTALHKHEVHFCDRCELPFYEPSSVDIHTKVVHEHKDFVGCILCYGKVSPHDSHENLLCTECSDISCIHKKYMDAFIEQKLNYSMAKVKCPSCDYRCRLKENFIRHANMEHLNRCPHVCDQCAQQFYDYSSLVQHINEYHKSVLHCKYCESPHDSAGALATHEAQCSETKREHACQYCAASFHTFKQLNKHHNTRHKETFPCQLCNKVYRTAYQKQQHVARVHGDVKKKMFTRYVCKLCHEVFELKGELLYHRRSHQGPDAKYNCKPCGTEFDCLQSLESHNKTSHSTTDRVVCTKCGLKVKQSALEQHLEEHKWDTKVDCDQCGRSFTNIMRLKFHFRKQHGIRCKLCDYGTQTNQSLEAHVNRIHKRIRPYVCHLCGKQFYGRVSLTKHTTYCRNRALCPKCGKGFSTEYNLKKHLFTHAKGDTLFECDVCGDKFRSADAKNLHILRTHDEKCVTCPNCPKKFLTMVNLNTHIKHHHSEGGQW